jgi:hypothetical protein
MLAVAIPPLPGVPRYRPAPARRPEGLPPLLVVQGRCGTPALRPSDLEPVRQAAPGGAVTHPDWCARGHRCSTQLGEHRSEPITVRTRYGLLILTRVRQRGRDRLELRTVVDLPAEPVRARWLAARVLLGVHRTVRRITAAVRA